MPLHISIQVRALVSLLALGAVVQAATYTDFYGQSWIGAGTPDVVANGGGLIPVVPSTAPADPDMNFQQHFNGIVYDGQYFANKRAATAYSTSDCLVFDWTHSTGWVSGIIAQDTHYWDFFSNNDAAWKDPNLKLVMWLKGSAGGEEKKFVMNMQEWPVTTPTVSTANTPSSAIPPITTSWQKIVIPISAFLAGKTIHATGYHTLVLVPAAPGSMVLYVDHVYFTTRTVEVLARDCFVPTVMAIMHPRSIVWMNGNGPQWQSGIDVFDLKGRVAGRDLSNLLNGGNDAKLGDNCYILRTSSEKK
jgi:hypothetical protein